MTAVLELLAECAARGIELVVAGKDALTIDGPQGAFTDEFLNRLKAAKAEVLASLVKTSPAGRPDARGSCPAIDVVPA
jgi:hypothetical protein